MSAEQTAARTTGDLERSDALENLARIGLLAYGLVHVLVAWLAIELAWFGRSSGGSADQSGAMATLADSPVGKGLLWILAAGLVALAVWQAAEVLRLRYALSGIGRTRTKALGRSVKAISKAVVYAGLAVLAIKFAVGSGQSSSQQQQQTTQGVFGWPFGQWLVAAVGLVLVGVGIYHIVKGFKKRFLKEIDLAEAPWETTRLVTRIGQVGYPGKGIALGVVGGLLIYAAVTFDPNKATGLDGAMRAILQAPFGGVLLTAVALGIACFGLFCFVRARYPERT